MVEGLISSFSILQYSISPLLRDRDFYAPSSSAISLSTIMEIAWQIGFEDDVVISTVTYSREEFEKGPCSESGLVQNIFGYGIAA
ncbi:MAG: hypothetical protein P8X90_14540 [Desulfobacterales bacterium]